MAIVPIGVPQIGAGPSISSGAGTPENIIAAGIGALYLDTTTGALWHKTSGTATTGWVRTDFGGSNDKYPGLMGPVFNVKAFGAVGDGVTDDTAAIQAAVDAAAPVNGIVFAPQGSYLLNTGISRTGGKLTIQGAGRRSTIFKAGGAITMFSFQSPGVGSFMGHVSFRDCWIDGNNVATTGMSMLRVNLSLMENVEIYQIAGRGLHLQGVQDYYFFAVDVRNSGHFANQHPGVHIVDFGADESNSHAWVGGTIERNRYHGMLLDTVDSIKLLGVKLHGRTTADDATPDAVDLLRVLGSQRVSVIGCQFTQGRQFGVFADQNGAAATTNMQVVGCTFVDGANYQSGGAYWHIGMGKARIIRAGNQFAFSGLAHTSYTSLGGDIWVQSTAPNQQPPLAYDLHDSQPGTKIKDDSTTHGIFVLTDDVTITTNVNNGTEFLVTLGGNRTIGAPTNPVKGQRITYFVRQDGTGGRTLAWNAVFKVSWSDVGNTASKTSGITFEYDGANWMQVSAQGPYV